MSLVYQIRFFDSSGDVWKVLSLELAHDEAAMAAANGLSHDYGLEVLQGERLIGRFPPHLNPL